MKCIFPELLRISRYVSISIQVKKKYMKIAKTNLCRLAYYHCNETMKLLSRRADKASVIPIRHILHHQ